MGNRPRAWRDIKKGHCRIGPRSMPPVNTRPLLSARFALDFRLWLSDGFAPPFDIGYWLLGVRAHPEGVLPKQLPW